MASQGAACPADGAAVGADGIRRAVQPADRGIHLGTGGKGRGQVLDGHQGMPRHPDCGRTDLCVLLLCTGQARYLLAALADPAFSGQLFQQSGLLRTEWQRRDRQPGSAYCRRHQYLYPAIPVLSAGTDRRSAVSRGFQWRALVDFHRTGLFSGHLCDCRAPRSRCWCSEKS
jgi:hypothetical protein